MKSLLEVDDPSDIRTHLVTPVSLKERRVEAGEIDTFLTEELVGVLESHDTDITKVRAITIDYDYNQKRLTAVFVRHDHYGGNPMTSTVMPVINWVNKQRKAMREAERRRKVAEVALTREYLNMELLGEGGDEHQKGEANGEEEEEPLLENFQLEGFDNQVNEVSQSKKNCISVKITLWLKRREFSTKARVPPPRGSTMTPTVVFVKNWLRSLGKKGKSHTSTLEPPEDPPESELPDFV